MYEFRANMIWIDLMDCDDHDLSKLLLKTLGEWTLSLSKRAGTSINELGIAITRAASGKVAGCNNQSYPDPKTDY